MKDKVVITMSNLKRIRCLLRGDPIETTEPPQLYKRTPVWEREDYSIWAECAYYARLIDALYEALWKMGDDNSDSWCEYDTDEPHIEIFPQSPYVRIAWHYQGSDFEWKLSDALIAAACGKAEKEAVERRLEEIKRYSVSTSIDPYRGFIDTSFQHLIERMDEHFESLKIPAERNADKK